MRKISISTFLGVFNTVPIIIGSLLLVLIPSSIYKKSYLQQSVGYCSDIATQTSVEILGKLNSFDLTISQIINSSSFSDFLHSINDDSEDSWRNFEYRQYVSDFFPSYSTGSSYIRAFDLYLKDSDLIYTFGPDSTQLSESFADLYFENAILTPTRLRWLGYDEETDCAEAVRLIYDRNSYETIGVVFIRVSRDFFVDTFENYDMAEITDILVLNEDNYVIASKAQGSVGQVLSYGEEANDNENYSLVNDNNGWISIQRRYENFDNGSFYEGWSTIVRLDKMKILQNYKYVNNRILLIAAIIASAIALLTLVISKAITSSIKVLHSSIIEIGKGNYSYRCPSNLSIREFAEVGDGLNELAENTEHLISVVYEQRINQKDMQLKILRTRINPHFLFNVLQMISLKADECGAEDVCIMIGSLSRMLDTELSTSTQMEHKLISEKKYLDDYAQIISCQYDDTISIIIDIPDDLYECLVPTLVIQPIVENAVVHGLAPKLDGGHVSVYTQVNDNELSIIISDNGVGMTESELRTLIDQIEGNLETTQSHRIALRNIRARLNLLYGESYGMDIDSKLYAGTTVTIRIPYRH